MEAGKWAPILDIRGELVLSAVTIKLTRLPLIWLYGNATLTNAEIRDSSATILHVKSGAACALLSAVSVSRLTAPLLQLSPTEFFDRSFQVHISASKFEDNQAWPLLHLTTLPGIVTITNSTFARNRMTAYPSYNSLILRFRDCAFTGNRDTIVHAMQLTNAEISIANCTFAGNRDAAFYVRRFTGLFRFQDSQVTQQELGGVLYQLNDWNEAGPCTVDFLHSTITHINATVSALHQVHAIHVYKCPAYIADLTITNVSLIAAPAFIHDSVLAGFFTVL